MNRYEVKFAADDVDAKTGEFSGYGSVFGNVDLGGDVVVKGAFKSTLRAWKSENRYPPMLLQHGGWGMSDTDGIPVGKWTKMTEDDHGLYVEGRLINLDTDLGKRVYGAMKEGVLDGMSIGYKVKKYTLGTKPKEPRRKIEELDLVELSVVTMPMNTAARVEAVKSLSDLSVSDWRSLEKAFRDDGFSHSESRRAVSTLKNALYRDDEAEPEGFTRDELKTDELAEMLRQNLKIFA